VTEYADAGQAEIPRLSRMFCSEIYVRAGGPLGASGAGHGEAADAGSSFHATATGSLGFPGPAAISLPIFASVMMMPL
jgi:hypothetical protein